MGIPRLLPFLEDISMQFNIQDLQGTTVGVDSYCWLRNGAITCAEQLARGEDTNLYLKYCLKYITLLLSHGIKPIMVFEGQILPAKSETEAKRHQQRRFARSRGIKSFHKGKYEEARQFFEKWVDVTHDMALKLIKECRRRSIDCIVAPYEANAQLAHLNTEGIVDYIITECSDILIFGCKKVIFNLGLDGSGYLVEQSRLHLTMKMSREEFTFEKFRHMCIMAGCDYLNPLAGVGLKRAHKAISMTAEPDIYKLLPRLSRSLKMRNLMVTPEYIENFKLADATIKHHIVYNPITRRLQRLTDPTSCGTDEKYLRLAGELSVPADRAFQLAIGNIDPITQEIMDNWNPNETDTPANKSRSIWSEKYKKRSLPKNTNRIIELQKRCSKRRKLSLSVVIDKPSGSRVQSNNSKCNRSETVTKETNDSKTENFQIEMLKELQSLPTSKLPACDNESYSNQKTSENPIPVSSSQQEIINPVLGLTQTAIQKKTCESQQQSRASQPKITAYFKRLDPKK